MRLINLTGQQFGRLKVIQRMASQNGHATWLCLCECGQQAQLDAYNLIEVRETKEEDTCQTMN